MKLHVPFQFDKVIHVDRFMFKNREAMKTARERVASLKQQVSAINQRLSAIADYKASGMDLV